ncbi:MAG: outer membrane beta-barrel protein [Candidatus Adiutrix sp.]|jgi:opacity protein-like surface antigen|nr:outer membrane beta-barrel protein [Candidatus Adiutrix sp.]
MTRFAKTLLVLLALFLVRPAAASFAQDVGGMYITPRVIYSYKTGSIEPARLNSGPYAASLLGGEDKDKGYGVGLAVGCDFGSLYEMPLRLEAEYVYRGKASFGEEVVNPYGLGGQASHNFDVAAHSLMANAFLDLASDSAMTPYIGGGLGLAYLNTDYTVSSTVGTNGSALSSKTNWNFAWNLGGGLAWHMNEKVALDLGYRYVDLGTASTGDIRMNDFLTNSSLDYTVHEISLGLRFNIY